MYIDALRTVCVLLLRDGTGVDFKDTDMDVYIGEVLKECSKAVPRKVKETVSLSALSVDVDISDIEDLLSVEYAEYPVDRDPKEIRNVEVFGTTCTIVTDRRPSGTESAYLYCHKMHTLSESESTIPPTMEDVLIKGVVAKSAMALSREKIGKVNVGGYRSPHETKTWAQSQRDEYKQLLDEMTEQQITQLYPTA